MMCLAVVLLSLLVITINACPEPQTTVHIQNYDGPIILHSANCDDQIRILSNSNPCNQYGNPFNQYNPCDNDCTCVSQQSYYPYNPTPQNVYYPTVGNGCYPTTTQGSCYPNTMQSGCYPTATVSGCYPTATNLGCGNQYSVVESAYSGYNSCNRCGSNSCQCTGCC